MVQPTILVTADRRTATGFKDSPRVRPRRNEVWLKEYYIDAVHSAGGMALVLPPTNAPVERLLALADGVVLTGGDFDIHPSAYGEDVAARLDRVEPARTHLELALAAECLRRGVPVLGICGGMQALWVAAGGKLIQHLPTTPLNHEQPTDDATAWHSVRLAEPATRWMGDRVQVNSTHHQAARGEAADMVACGWSEPDGVIEVVAGRRDDAFAVGVQWHPEAMGDVRLYTALIAACTPR